ncbi:MAG: NUDIX hydrolase [Deltaproteobacteria bacterium]|nr:NUDIX hydrolase [Deltaproteobacteria bacterium]
MVEPWPLEEEQELTSFRIGGLVRMRLRSPRTGRTHTFYELRFTDWVNVVALTDDGRVLLIRQFRAGTRSVTLEIPGGLVEPGESPLAAARRELREETGYEAPTWRPLGAVLPNPAIQGNRCHTFLACGAHRVGEPQLEAAEDIDVEPTPLAEIPALAASGAIDHTLVLSAFLRLWLDGGAGPALVEAGACVGRGGAG